MSEDDPQARLMRAIEFRQAFDDRLARIDGETPFDSVYDVDTGRSVELWELPEEEQLQIGRNARYSPTPVRTVRNVLARCGVEHEKVTFVDIGCGKGRVLLLAAELPFRRIVGVEASATLCAVARRNVAALSGRDGEPGRIEVVHADATKFDVPDDAGLFYFYEPFSSEVSSAVLERIEDSIRRHPRRVVLCYVGKGQPDGQANESEVTPVAAAAARTREQWSLVEVVPSPDAEFYESLLFEHVGRGSGAGPATT